MRRNSLIVRTGLQRGVIYNGTGENLTDDPGAGNAMVGSYALDFSALPWGGQTTEGTSQLNDNEYTIVLADGRGLQDDNLDDDNDLELDETNPERDDGAFIDESTSWASVDGVTVEWRFIRPTYEDAHVYTVSGQTGEVSTPEATLAQWLDQRITSLGEATGDVDYWSEFRSNLRFTLHWALMLLDCVAPADEGINDFTENNAALIHLANNPVPVAGPGGLISVLGNEPINSGSTVHTRLWMPQEGNAGMRIIKRGQLVLPYNLRGQYHSNEVLGEGSTGPDDANDIDVIDMDDEVVEHHGYSQPAVDTQRGRDIVLSFRHQGRIRVRDDQMLVFCVQTGRARLTRDTEDHLDLVIAGPPLVQGRNGPILRPYYWYARLRGTTR